MDMKTETVPPGSSATLPSTDASPIILAEMAANASPPPRDRDLSNASAPSIGQGW